MPDQGGLSLNSWAVLALLVDDGPQHGFALSRSLARGTDLGRVWAVPRPLVYRALDQLERRGLVASGDAVPSPAGPSRQVRAATPEGVVALERWRSEPVPRLRDVRSTLVLKLTLAVRAGIDVAPLLRAQREVFAPLVDELREASGVEPAVVDVWREELVLAVDRTLERLLDG